MQPSPLDDRLGSSSDEAGGFAPLLVAPAPARPADPPLGTAGTDPLLGPVPAVDAPPAANARPAPDAPAPRRTAIEPDVIWATGRSTEQVLALVRTARSDFPDRAAVVLRAPAETLVALATEHDAYTTMDAAASAAAVGPLPDPAGRVAVLSAGGGDAAVAAEAAFVARITGTEVVRVAEVGGSRMRALIADPSGLPDVDCLVVVAGMDASLVPLIGALTDVPVVAVPTSAGQPTAFAGLGALLTMLNSSAPGVAVSAVDNGYSAGVFAARVARRTA